MIDYDKLKLAHELATKLNEDALISVQFWSNEVHRYDYRLELHGITKYLTGDIGLLIDHLLAITNPEPKYKFGDTVWSLKKRGKQGVMSGFVDNSDGDKDKYYVLYDGEGAYWQTENELYPSREALIDAQIDYWYKLKGEAVKDSLSQCIPQFEGEIKGFNCQHDEYIAVSGKTSCRKCGLVLYESCDPKEICTHESSDEMLLINTGTYKCIKCGEFYR